MRHTARGSLQRLHAFTRLETRTMNAFDRIEQDFFVHLIALYAVHVDHAVEIWSAQ